MTVQIAYLVLSQPTVCVIARVSPTEQSKSRVPEPRSHDYYEGNKEVAHGDSASNVVSRATARVFNASSLHYWTSKLDFVLTLITWTEVIPSNIKSQQKHEAYSTSPDNAQPYTDSLPVLPSGSPAFPVLPIVSPFATQAPLPTIPVFPRQTHIPHSPPTAPSAPQMALAMPSLLSNLRARHDPPLFGRRPLLLRRNTSLETGSEDRECRWGKQFGVAEGGTQDIGVTVTTPTAVSEPASPSALFDASLGGITAAPEVADITLPDAPPVPERKPSLEGLVSSAQRRKRRSLGAPPSPLASHPPAPEHELGPLIAHAVNPPSREADGDITDELTEHNTSARALQKAFDEFELDVRKGLGKAGEIWSGFLTGSKRKGSR
ncbi:hypothetical protein LTR95_004205 [Oleoguttula sp. CCFEE 5521]